MTSASFHPEETLNPGKLILSQEAFLANKHQKPQLSTVETLGWMAPIADYGQKCCGSCDWSGLESWLLKMFPDVFAGPTRSKVIWRELIIAFPSVDTRCRLRILVLLINVGACSGLPTVTARDWRAPGPLNHSRLDHVRGEPLTETLGFRLSPEFCEWMMGFPSGFTDATGSKQ